MSVNSLVDVQSKSCSKCKEIKLFDEFHKAKRQKTGYRSDCKCCCIKSANKYRANNSEKRKESCAKYRQNNSGRVKESRTRYYQNNSNKVRENSSKYRLVNPDYYAKYRQNNLDKFRKKQAKRRATKLLAIPGWLTKEDFQAIEAIYTEAKRLELETGLKYHVDHIEPLQGKLVCGFHCPANLQILTESENCSKGNKFTPYVESELIN